MKTIIFIILFTISLNAQSGDLIMLFGEAVTIDTLAMSKDINSDFELGKEYDSDFSAGVDSWVAIDGVLVGNVDAWGNTDVLSFEGGVSANRVLTVRTIAGDITDFQVEIKIDYYVPSATSSSYIEFRHGASQVISSTAVINDSWESVDVIVTNSFATGSETQYRIVWASLVSGDSTYVKNISLTSYPSFTATGNHSFTSESSAPITGTYSGKITASGAGDASTNYVTLAAAEFTTLTAGNNAYISFNALASTTDVDVTMVIGGKSKTWTGVDNSSAELLEWEFKVTGSEVGQDIQIYLSKAANIIIDDFGN